MSSPFITGQTLGGSLRGDAQSSVGFKMTVGSSNLSVVSLGFSPLAMVNAEPTIALEVGVDVAFDEDVHFGQGESGATRTMMTEHVANAWTP